MNKEQFLELVKKMGKLSAEAIQNKADALTGTELYTEADFIPTFSMALGKMNMLERPIGFVCRSPQGRVVKLLQPYDSTVFTQEPEELPAQWGFKWSTNPKHALPFIALSTSPYDMSDCCIGSDDVIYRSKININTYDPVVSPQFWEVVTDNQ